ncbi:MAG: lamin tail domain-containing protein [Myxococcota bacterium]|nr:lamin tail domain-containing protein [Myxococcota bacterium]
MKWMSISSASLVALAAIAMTACGSDPVPADDAGRDAGRDSGRDAAMTDAAMADASMDDASMGDGGTATCGDGVIGGDEECDDGAANSDTEIDACRTDCTLADCGDDVTDTGEICDGADLGGRTCVDESFMSGVLGCAADCSAYDTTMCSSDPGAVCNDGMLEAPEECDGTELGGMDCEDVLGAGAIGALACESDCTFDSSACTLCGNGVIDTGEACDGTALGGATCAGGGTISCTATCMLDMSLCTTCGNGVIDAGEDCDGTELGGATCATRPGFMSGTLACAAGCAFDVTMCRAAATPTAAGQLVISEVMQNPEAFGSDPNGEFFEVHNPGAAALNLFGCIVDEADGAPTFTIDSNVVVPAGGYATFAATTSVAGAPGFTPSFSYPSSFALGNGADSVRITCGATVIDSLAWDGGPMFPDPTAASMQLDPAHLSATANDTGANWCTSMTAFGGAATPDLGTPGAANEACPAAPPTWTVTYCRLQFPQMIEDEIGTSHTVYGRVYAAGLTDMTTATDTSATLMGAVGYGPADSDPATAATWTWTPAIANPAWLDTAEPNNDEYMATLVAPAPAGTYDFAYRFSGDGGATWVYCDTDTTPGYLTALDGELITTTPTTPAANIWINELHYDDDAGDVEEGVEVAGPAGTALAGYTVVPYNGATGASYTPIAALSGTIPDQGGGFGTVWVPIVLQNGGPDGVALVGPVGVVQFLCYEGSFTATNGPAMGTTCVDIGVSEAGTETDMSLQLTGTGNSYSSFTWTGPVMHTRGAINASQTIM